MSVLNYFKNTPGRPPIGRQDLSVIFFFKFATRSLEKKGRMSPLQRGRQGGPVAPPSGDRGMPPCISSNPPLPSSFESENSTKNPEKKERGEEK